MLPLAGLKIHPGSMWRRKGSFTRVALQGKLLERTQKLMDTCWRVSAADRLCAEPWLETMLTGNGGCWLLRVWSISVIRV